MDDKTASRIANIVETYKDGVNLSNPQYVDIVSIRGDIIYIFCVGLGRNIALDKKSFEKQYEEEVNELKNKQR